MEKSDLIHKIVRSDGGLDHGHHIRTSLDAEKLIPDRIKDNDDGRKTRPTISRRQVRMALAEEKKKH